ncbi:hypothetical protein OH799_31115 [Nocardia sp. NBC_00881]|uniref:hypothetical protein n=1 Tax=Nocardia sp. NBC_00881 TaxID=2975995 RepID=UPI003862D77C|nr:hypothetical protein OH799_31115 [Nocardia sp. NBC_00881]
MGDVFYQYKDGEWVLANDIGSTPQEEGYYYYENSAGDMRPYYCSGDGKYQAINYDERNVIDSEGNLHKYDGGPTLSRSYSDVSSTSTSHISSENVEGFDPPPPSGGNENDEDGDGSSGDELPAVEDRRGDRLEPGEKLAPEGSTEVDEGKARNSITNGDYTLTLDADKQLILTDKDGNELWGYAGADVADLLTDPNNDVKLGVDGSIKVIDRDTGEVLRVIREADDTKHVKLVLLYHPPAESEPLRIAINEAQKCLQLQVDCFGKGKASLAEDVADWLQNEGLLDKDNKSSTTDSHNSYLNQDTQVKKHFKDLDEKIRSIAVATEEETIEGVNSITAEIDELDEQLHAIDALKDVQTKSVGTMGSHTYKQILPDLEEELFTAIDKTVEDVDKIVDDAQQANEEKEREVDEDSHEYKSGYEDGYQAGLGDAGGLLPAATTEDFGAQTDYSDVFGDLTNAGLTDGLTDASGTTGDGSSLFDQLRNSLTGGAVPAAAATGAGVGAAAAGSGANSMLGMMMPMMMMQMMSQMMQQAQQKDRDRSQREREQEAQEQEDRHKQQEQATAQQQATVTTAAQQTATADPAATAPPPIGGSGAMVDMRLPNGATQKVSAAVAEAVNREFNNPNGSDARAAYAGTLGESTSGHTWTTIDSASLRTGDIVQWENRSAIAVVTDDGLHYITNGQLVPLDPHNPVDDNHGPYGAFQGFFHPTGVDAATAPTDTLPTAPPTIDMNQSTPTAPPPITAPTPQVAAPAIPG